MIVVDGGPENAQDTHFGVSVQQALVHGLVVLLLSDAVGLDEQATPVLDVGQGVLGDGVALRVQEQKVFAEGFIVLFLGFFQLPTLAGGAPEHFRIPVEQNEVGIGFSPLDALPQVVVRFSYPTEALCAAVTEECAQPEGILSDTRLIEPHVDLRKFKVSLLDVQPHIGVLPVVDGIELAAAGDALHFGVGNALEAGQAFRRAQTDKLDAVRKRLGAERLVVHFPCIVKVGTVHDGKIGRFAHPDIFLARLPRYPRFGAGQVVNDGHLLERQAKPQEFCADRQEVAPPAVCCIDHRGVKPLLVDERHRQLLGVQLTGENHFINEVGHAQAILAGRKAQVDFAAVGEHISDADLRSLQHVQVAFHYFHRHISSPHFGQRMYRCCSAPLRC